jgi:Cu(I)/Ag(I) efflux system membrane fusion protein
MNDAKLEGRGWRRLLPGTVHGAAGLVLVAVLAFFLGGLLIGGGHESHDVAGDDGRSAAAEPSEPSAWTCSMHPQIQLPKQGKCPICFMDLIPVESGGGEDLDPGQIRMSETAKELARIETVAVRRAYAERAVRMVGKLAYDETSVASITAWIPGRLDRLYADFTGVTVRKGDHMVSMYSPELLATQEEILQARRAIDALGATGSGVLKSTASATLEAAREKLRLFGLTEKQIETIESSGVISEHLTIYAPIGGVVVEKHTLEGMYVETGTRIYTIADLSRLWVMFEAYESDLPWLRYGQQVKFTSPSFPGEEFEALISFIGPVVDRDTRSVRVRAVVENKGLRLKPEMFVHGVVLSRVDGRGDVIDENLAGMWISPMHPEVVKDGPGSCDVCAMPLVPAESLGYAGRSDAGEAAPLMVPASAPLITGKRAIVYVDVSDADGPVFEGREIQLGPRAGNSYVVVSGLEEGDLVVTNGAFKIDSELQIQAKPSMMSPVGDVAAPGHRGGTKIGGAHVVTHDSHGVDVAGSGGDPLASAPGRLDESKDVLSALAPVYEKYFEVQMALAGDDHGLAAKAAREVEERAKSVNMRILSPEGHKRWMALLEPLSEAALSIAESGDIVSARDGFYFLSRVAVELHDSFGHSGEADYYLTFCPMARNNAGAHWLQTENVVWNSFYGPSMLRCGVIEKSLPPVDPNAE